MQHMRRFFCAALAVASLTSTAFAKEYALELVWEQPAGIASVAEFGPAEYGYTYQWISPEIGKQNVLPVETADSPDGNMNAFLKIEHGKVLFEKGETKAENTITCFYEGGKYGMRAEDGTVVIQPIYDEIVTNTVSKSFTHGTNGLIPVRINNKWGLIDSWGNEILAPISNSKPSLMNNDGTDYNMDERLQDKLLYSYHVYDRENGIDFDGVVDSEGNIVLEPKHCYLVWEVGMLSDGRYIFTASVNDPLGPMRHGVIDQYGTVIVPFEYTQISLCYDALGSAPGSRAQAKDILRCNGLYIGSTGWGNDDGCVLINAQGNVISQEYPSLGSIFVSGLTTSTYYDAQASSFAVPSYSSYVVDKAGKTRLSKKGYALGVCSDSLLLGISFHSEGTRTSLLSMDGKVLSVWNTINPFNSYTPDRLIAYEQIADSYDYPQYLLDPKTGKSLLGPFTFIWDFRMGLAAASNLSGESYSRPDVGLIAENGTWLLPCEYGDISLDMISEHFPYFTASGKNGTSIYKLHTSGTAVPSKSTVYIDGMKTQFDVYAVVDSNGNYSNYFKVRDLAHALNGTQAQFEVSWNGAVNLDSGTAYTPNGSEGTAIFSGNQNYGAAFAPVFVDGERRFIDSIILTDANGGGHTYYKLSDLGYNLGFDVSWNGTLGAIEIETDKPYTDG